MVRAFIGCRHSAPVPADVKSKIMQISYVIIDQGMMYILTLCCNVKLTSVFVVRLNYNAMNQRLSALLPTRTDAL